MSRWKTEGGLEVAENAPGVFTGLEYTTEQYRKAGIGYRSHPDRDFPLVSVVIRNPRGEPMLKVMFKRDRDQKDNPNQLDAVGHYLFSLIEQ